MRPQSFRICQGLDDRGDPLQTGPRKPLNADDFYVIENAEPASEAGSAAGGENVIRARRIIARRLG